MSSASRKVLESNPSLLVLGVLSIQQLEPIAVLGSPAESFGVRNSETSGRVQKKGLRSSGYLGLSYDHLWALDFFWGKLGEVSPATKLGHAFALSPVETQTSKLLTSGHGAHL